jgi:hypothetical protein
LIRGRFLVGNVDAPAFAAPVALDQRHLQPLA